MSETERGLGDRELELRLYSGVEVLRSQQSEINRRIGALERKIEVALVDPQRIVDMEGQLMDLTKPVAWKEYVFQAVGWGIGITLLVTIAGLFGVEVKW